MTTVPHQDTGQPPTTACDLSTVLWFNLPDPQTPAEQLQGTWLASSVSLNAELPQLLSQMQAEDRLVTHVFYNPLDWRVECSRLSVAGVNVTLGALSTQARSTIGLVDAVSWRRWDLAVILPF